MEGIKFRDRAERCPSWVKKRNTPAEHMFSATPPTTDMRRLHRNDRFVPNWRHAIQSEKAAMLAAVSIIDC
jgi:hypothetical protein